MPEPQIRKKVRIKEKKAPKKSKWWLWLCLPLALMAIAAALVFLVKRGESDGINQPVSGKIEQAIAKTGEIAEALQSPTVNFENAQAKVAEAQQSVDAAKAKASTKAEQQAVAEAQAKVDEAARTVEAAKQAAAPATEKTPTAENKETPATETKEAVAETTNGQAVAKTSAEKAKPAQNGQPAKTKPATGTMTSANLPAGTLEEKALQVIRGTYGNGTERKNALGGEYREIQAKVNEIYRKGLVN